MALGKLGWTEYEYYTCSPESFYYACQGYFSKLQDESLAIRNAATIIFRVMGGKEDMDRIWPIGEKKKEVFELPDKDWWEEMKKSNVLNIKPVSK